MQGFLLTDDYSPDAGLPAPDDDARSALYGLSEAAFSAVAPAMVARGWSVFPQTQGRMPGKVNHQTIRPQADHDLEHRLPDPKTMDLWCRHCGTNNTACMLGPASGNTFVLDADVDDAVMARRIVDLADEILGYTPFRREGRAPKIALIYRHGPGEDERISRSSRFFATVDEHGNAGKSEHQLEILGKGSQITFHGLHHKTGRYYKWLDANPITTGPEAAPLVTRAQMQTFIEAVDSEYRFHRGAAFLAPADTWNYDEGSKALVPSWALAGGSVPWTDDEDGKVSDGREAYLKHLVYTTFQANLTSLEAAREAGREALKSRAEALAKAVGQQFVATAVMDSKWTRDFVQRDATAKMRHIVEKWTDGRMAERRASSAVTVSSDGAKLAAGVARTTIADTFTAPPTLSPDPELCFLPPNPPGSEMRRLLRGRIDPPVPGAESLAIPADRTQIALGISQAVEGALRAFFSDVYGHPTGYGPIRRVGKHILKAPPGSGKTSRAIRFIAEDPRTYRDHTYVDEEGREKKGRCPIVFLVPTYDNIGELRSRALVLNLDPDLDDDGLRAAARELEIVETTDLAAFVGELRRDALGAANIAMQASGDARGLVTMVYSGKIKAGCRMEDKVGLAMQAGIGTAGFCKAPVPPPADKNKGKAAPKGRRVDRRPPEDREVRCEYYEGCPAIQQRTQIADAHVVFMPHAFMALSIPDELKHARAVIADERVHHLFLHTAVFSASALTIGRKPPRLTAKEREANVTPEDMLSDRDAAAGIAHHALLDGTCPAAALFALGDRGRSLVKNALRVCGSAIQKDGTVTPTMTLEEVKALCSQPAGKEVREEYRFWKIVGERLEALQHDALRSEVIAGMESAMAAEEDPAGRADLLEEIARFKSGRWMARGDRDYRIQHLTEHAVNGGTSEMIRLSWRTSPNWPLAPALLLDASASPPIIAKIWGMREDAITTHDIVPDLGRVLNVKVVAVVDRTFSNSSLVATPGASKFERVRAAQNLAAVRGAIATVAGLYADGRVVVGTSILLRKVINEGWASPPTVDSCHYGAMRGLDGFKHHGAALSVGRMEVPPRTIDGLVAALTYDDADPEPPFDIRGDGLDPAPERQGQALRLPMGEQCIRLRSGHFARIPVPTFPGRWGRMIQEQYREEELNQFLGRLRPVYREGRTPVWVALSSVLPSGIVVDEIIAADDLAHGIHPDLWDAARRSGGVLHPGVMSAVAPDLFASKEEAEAVLDKCGFGDSGSLPRELQKRLRRGWDRVDWRVPAGPWRGAFAMAALEDREGAVREAVSVHLGLADVETRAPAKRPSMSRARAPDKVEDSIGSAASRRMAESERLAALAEKLLDTPGEISSTLFSHRNRKFPVPGAPSKQLFAFEYDAMLSLESYWNKVMGAADDRLEPVIPDAPDDLAEGGDYSNYERLGAVAFDMDAPIGW